jgi:hypothetical protein
MARPARLTSVLRRRRGTIQPQNSATLDAPRAATRAAIAPEAPGCVPTPSGYHDSGEGRTPHQAARARRNPAGLAREEASGGGKPGSPPGIVVFQPPPKRAASYPRFVRQLSPNEDRLIQPDPITGKWPRLRAELIATPSGARWPIDWATRQPSKRAFSAWLRDSAPLTEPAPLTELELAAAE